MGVTEDYKLSIYQDLGLLGTKEHIRLVRNKKTGQICVRKTVDYTQQDVVEFRRKNSSLYFPKLYEVIENDDKWIIIEEYINGVTLEDYMMGEPLLEENAEKTARQVCKALLELHCATPMIVYRDLKTENIMITSEGTVKLIDFDISRSFQEGKKRDTILLGTAEYAAPEQFGYFQTDNRTDIYAFGILFNYMLTGKYPIDSVTEGKYESMIQKCIELEPSKRYQRVEEILEELGGEENELEDEQKNIKCSWALPGFRSNTGWKKVFAILGYILIISISMDMDYVQKNGEAYPMLIQWINRITMMVAQLAAVFFCCNYRGIADGFKPYQHRYLIVRVISYIVTWFVFFCVSVMLANMVETILT